MKANNNKIDKRIVKIAHKLKQLRKHNGYGSYETFALDNNLDRKQYWRMENGTNFTINSLLKILDIHKITLKKILKILGNKLNPKNYSLQ